MKKLKLEFDKFTPITDSTQIMGGRIKCSQCETRTSALSTVLDVDYDDGSGHTTTDRTTIGDIIDMFF